MKDSSGKKYEDYDISTPKKRGYAARKTGWADEGASTAVERNIGPRMDIESVRTSERKTLPGETKTSSKKRSGEWQKGFDEAKAEEQAAIGPTYKKGGSVSSASKRADGCAQRGKTKGRMV